MRKRIVSWPWEEAFELLFLAASAAAKSRGAYLPKASPILSVISGFATFFAVPPGLLSSFCSRIQILAGIGMFRGKIWG